MRKLLYLSILLIGLSSCCGCDQSDQKYQISCNGPNYESTHNTLEYYTNEYIIQDGCVKFLEKKAKDTTIICGTYKIIKNPYYKVEKKTRNRNPKNNHL